MVGTIPFSESRYLNHAIYRQTKPAKPNTPKVKSGSFQGPGILIEVMVEPHKINPEPATSLPSDFAPLPKPERL